MFFLFFTLEGYAWPQSLYDITNMDLPQLDTFNMPSYMDTAPNVLHPNFTLTYNELLYYSQFCYEMNNLPYADQEQIGEEVEFGDENSVPSFNPYQAADLDVSLFPQSPTAIPAYVSSTNTTPISISSSSDSASTSSSLPYICSSYSEENFSDNISDNEYLSEGEDEVFSMITNACTRCGTDMGEMNPRQLCGKVRCLIYD